MGLFSRNEPIDIDPGLEETILAEDDRMRNLTKKLLAKSQFAILATLEPDETPITTVWKEPRHLLVITIRRLVDFKGAKIESELRHEDIDGAEVLVLANGHFKVKIETATSKMYRADDLRKFDPKHYMSVDTDDPRLARNLCTIINSAH